MAKYFWDDVIVNEPLCKALTDNFHLIEKEVLSYISKPDSLHDYPKYRVHNNKLIYEKYWKAAPFTKFNGEYVDLKTDDEYKSNFLENAIHRARSNCPTLISLISDYENKNILRNGFISKLIPGTIINPHVGWTDKFLRTHLCLVADPECFIVVVNEKRVWEKGKFLAFKDSDMHRVTHKGKNERVVVSVDISIDYLNDNGYNIG